MEEVIWGLPDRHHVLLAHAAEAPILFLTHRAMLLACALERGACPHIVTDVVVANDKVDSSAARWRERSKGGG